MIEKRVRKFFKRKKSVKIYFLHFFNDNKKPGKRAEAKNSFDFFQDCSLGFLMNRFLASESPMNSSHLEKSAGNLNFGFFKTSNLGFSIGLAF